MVVGLFAVLATYVRENVVPEITVVDTPNGTVGVEAVEELVIVVCFVVLLVREEGTAALGL